ncbi:MAG: hypothetical protein JSR39_03980 [Verrucomicrobia bacterium]|nr:hypothetical protein [Verrucomicrobiota bacterium]
MKTKSIIGSLLLICGIALIGFSMYVTSQVEEGKGKVSSAQSKVNKGKGLFSGDPLSEEIGKGLTSGAQKKIDEGKQQIVYYEGVAYWTKNGGIACIIIGLGVFFIPTKKSKR